jgi:DNA-binding beta-propeller fold protein YncE
LAVTFVALASLFPLTAVSDDNDRTPLLPQLATSPLQVVSTVPANGDLNPYGVAFVPREFAPGGAIHPGDVLVSNFNNSSNLQGTGTTIVSIARDGTQSLFFQGPKGLGLTTALGALRRGVVLVGNVPTTDGTSATVQQGSLIAIDRSGKTIASFTDSTLLDGPWDLTLLDFDREVLAFVSNVLNGTVTRLSFDISRDGEHVTLESATQIATGYLHRTDPAALVVGPTGLAFDRDNDLLYVASTGDNAIYAIRNPLRRGEAVNKGELVYRDSAHLRGPLGLIRAANGHLIATNGDAVNGNPSQPSEMIEFTPRGQFVAQVSVDTGGQGGAFGLALHGRDDRQRLAAVDDVVNTLEIWSISN